MKYSRKDLMNEGWASMETLLNQEMPKEKKDNNYWLIALFVVCAFGFGLITGTQIQPKAATAENQSINNSSYNNTQSISMLAPIEEKSGPERLDENQTTTATAKIARKVSKKTNTSNTTRALQTESNNTEKITQAVDQAPIAKVINTALTNSIVPASSFANVTTKAFTKSSLIGAIPFKEMVSAKIATSYLPRITRKVRNQTNWVLGLGLNTGVNVDRNTKVLSLNSDWMYKIGKQNAIGVQFLYAAEDEFGFIAAEPEITKPTNERPEQTQEGGDRNPSKELIQNARQYRFATGLVIQQEIGYRVYSNFAFGIDMLQNSYSEDIQLKSLNIANDIQYHFGGYTSLALGYRLSRLVDLEISATKSILLDNTGIYKPGNSDHIVGGLKISF